MSLKKKTIALFLIAFAILLITPSMVNATTYTYSDNEQGIEWSYELDSSENVVNLKCNTTSKIGAVTIPSTIDGKTVISIGNSKNSYEDGAFKNCAGITAVTIPNTISTIGYRAFYNCTGLKTVTIPNSVTKIGSGAFAGCSGLTTVNLSENLTSIETYAFQNCTGLKSITIPNSVTSVEAGAFQSCSGLKEITLSNSLSKISDKTFENCTGLTSVVIPNSVTTIEGEYSNIYGAFGNCKNLEKILIPDTVASIGTGAFRDCPKLTIYGNDGQTSKEYAEANGINFKYISQWDETDVGDDITPPTLEKLRIENSAGFKYDSGTGYYFVSPNTTISIKATFNELIYGNTAPTLTIKCGNGEKIELSNGVITGSYILYTYTIKEQDVGIISAVEMSGGDVVDEAGNAVTEYTCPTLTDSIWGDFVYANGSGIVTDPGDTNNPGETPKDENQGTDSKDENEQNTTDGKKDDTTAKQELPKAGKMTIISILIAAIIAGTTSFIKTRKYKGI